ncbi:MAG: hypothetical protein A2745_01050 [Candidatus Harrisonbacteria bacterium RIFCSPHIGHO2_01_FULL_44_13]|uniref:Uncharacterized protein n=1 Tax=Candidatus Harrisonbacteria bacterium RIFCSPLOWO2_01_FULL_44_18 TaxID=1798407 RepID=A0A1G1ZMF0_9BACT|nr:MAG: hypothetical protein A2745_01050 [Candidatus Harrisonbacteria bacterium RIFCSPHIGHO2_01_FULL_44_13]OGY65731.1 MAG: hypothetical protein A3A16_03915 [Candidatus Harrisonbacteria bacterium RIFCSPLOWO2_01_FULL_44_18]
MLDALTPAKTTIDFSSLPPLIREWLASNRLTYAIMAINRRLGFVNERQSILPSIIYDLATMEIRPQDFTRELSARLDISFSAAKIIAREIEEKILNPVETTLKNELGIDAKLIYLGEEQASKRPVAATKEKGWAATAPALKIEKTPEIKTPEISKPTAMPFPEIKSQPPKPASETPFILHEEPTTAKLTEEKQIPRPSFVFRAPAAAKPPSEKPVEVKLETAKQNKGRVVHYSNFRTKL